MNEVPGTMGANEVSFSISVIFALVYLYGRGVIGRAEWWPLQGRLGWLVSFERPFQLLVVRPQPIRP